MAPADEESNYELVQREISVTAFSLEHLRSLCKIAEELGSAGKIHIKVDTGLGRIGLRTEEELLKSSIILMRMKSSSRLKGFLHISPWRISWIRVLPFSSSTAIILLQYRVRPGLYARLPRLNSAAILDMEDAHFDLCRMGIAMYGYPPSGELEAFASELQPALSLKSTVIHVKTIAPGDSVSYGRTFIAEKPTEIATVVLGMPTAILGR